MHLYIKDLGLKGVWHDIFNFMFFYESMTPAINLLPVSLTPAIDSFHRFSVFDVVVDNGDKFIAGDNNTSDKFTAGDKNKDAMGVGSFQG